MLATKEQLPQTKNASSPLRLQSLDQQAPAYPTLIRTPWRLLLLLSALVLAIAGYHPWSNDAGVYLAGVLHRLDPQIYNAGLPAADLPFVAAHSALSAFAPAIVLLLRVSPLSLASSLFLIYLVSVFFYLYAGWQLACRLFSDSAARLGALWMAAVLYSLPVAGTALSIMDPYLTARSFSTPLALLAVAATLDRRYLRTALWIALAAVLHPLMAAYAFGFVVMLAAFHERRPRLAISLCLLSAVLAGLILRHAHFLPTPAGYRVAVWLPAHSYLFLSRWRWYEVCGAVIPLLLPLLAARKLGWQSPVGRLSLAILISGGMGLVLTAFFVPYGGPYPLVRFQFLRIDHIIYAVGVLLLGAFVAHLGRITPRWRRAIPVACLLGAGLGMATTARINYPQCRSIEWPGLAPTNPWSQAFTWIRLHTPLDARFAFAPPTFYAADEDEQSFRVIAQRSQLAGDKDSGLVVVLPRLAPVWLAEREATLGLNTESDAERIEHLAPWRAGWILLPPASVTGFTCPYQNRAIKVCKLP